ncbi:hypothetical protein Tco_1337902 [Tanacetum coccineum]
MKYQSRSYGNRLCKPLLCKHFVMNSTRDCIKKVFECYYEIAQRIRSTRLDTCNIFIKFPILEKFLNTSKTTRHDPSINIHIVNHGITDSSPPSRGLGGGDLRDYVSVVGGTDDEDMPSEALEQRMDANVLDEIDGAKGEQVPNHFVKKGNLKFLVCKEVATLGVNELVDKERPLKRKRVYPE